MQRLIFTVILILTSAVAATAQKGLAIDALFDGRYRKIQSATETTVKGDRLDQNYGITLYRSISITNDEKEAQKIEPLLFEDAKKAIDSEVLYSKETLRYAIFRLPDEYYKRYIMYLNREKDGENKIVLIYIEGNVKMKKLKQIFKIK